MACSSKFRWSAPPSRAVSSCYSYSLPSPATPPQIAKYHASIAAAAHTRLRIQLKAALHSENEANEEEEEDFQVLSAVQSNYNRIVILDTPKSRLLLLDSCHNVHSMINKESKWTGSYWDECAAFPPVLPRGPVAIFGLGGGTSAHLILDLWPSLQLEGWEIDGIAATWLELYDKLMPEGRFMVNCGAGEKEPPATNAISQHDGSSTDGSWKLNATIRALCEAFPGKVNWKKLPRSAGENYVALTGFLPDLTTWSATAPSELNSSINQWRTCNAER